jgi:hypothetical protein
MATRAIQTFRINRPIRGAQITLPMLRRLYADISKVIEKKAEEFVAGLKIPEGYTQEKFESEKVIIRENAFKVTVTLASLTGADIYGETIDVFAPEFIPSPLASVYMTNNTAFMGVFKSNPQENFSLLLDFGKPPVFDWASIVSNPTANNSNLTINGLDLTFVRSIESSVMGALQDRKPIWKFIHAPFAYDVGLWLLAVPYGIYQCTKVIAALTKKFPGFSDYKLGLYIYALILVLAVYRFFFQYVKWVFPLNVYADNQDSSAVHRSIIAAVALGLVGNVIYDLLR